MEFNNQLSKALSEDLVKINNNIYKGADGQERELHYFYSYMTGPTTKLFFIEEVTDEIEKIVVDIFNKHLGEGKFDSKASIHS